MALDWTLDLVFSKDLVQLQTPRSRGLSGAVEEMPDESGRRPLHGGAPFYERDPHWKDLTLFYEYFHGETGRGVGASHQTGWTALAVRLIEDLAKDRETRSPALASIPT